MLMFLIGFLACVVLATVRPSLFSKFQASLIDFFNALKAALSKGPDEKN